MILGEFEIDDLHHFVECVRPGDVVFDIGANVGAYSLPIAKAAPTSRVFAFEPIPLNAALLNASRLVNRLANLRVEEKCVSDSSGTAYFSISTDSAYSSMIDTQRKSELERVQCEAVSLSDFCTGTDTPAPQLIKIDVEGAELRVLDGAERLFTDKALQPRMVMIELFDKNLVAFGSSIQAVVSRMEGWGYEPYAVVDGAKQPFTRAHHNVNYNVFFSR